MRRPIGERQYLFADEVADDLGCSIATVNRYANGKVKPYPPLPFMPRGNTRRTFLKTTLNEWKMAAEQIGARLRRLPSDAKESQ